MQQLIFKNIREVRVCLDQKIVYIHGNVNLNKWMFEKKEDECFFNRVEVVWLFTRKNKKMSNLDIRNNVFQQNNNTN